MLHQGLDIQDYLRKGLISLSDGDGGGGGGCRELNSPNC